MKKLINLHNHSHYSILDGLSSPKHLIDKAIEDGVNSVALTDHGNLNGWGNFYQYAKSKNFKPIFGCEFYYVPDLNQWKKDYEGYDDLDRLEKKKKMEILKQRNHVILLAKNQNGFNNLNKLIFESFKNIYYKPRIDRELIVKYHKDLIFSTACIAGEVQTLLCRGEKEKAEEVFLFYKDLFKEDFYAEIQVNNLPDQKISNNLLIEMAKKHNVKIIITSDTHYAYHSEASVHQTMLLLQTKKTYEDLKAGNAWSFGTDRVFMKSFDDLLEDCKNYNPEITEKDLEEFCDNTFGVDSKIEHIHFDTSIKVKDVVPQIEDKDELLKNHCLKKLKEKNLGQEYVDRLNFELDVIKQKKFAKYFLLVYKTVKDAKKSQLVGAGRGSAGGSLINYLLGITEIDPIRYNLFFERFLTLNRMDPPDIDIDFENNDQVKTNLLAEYGNDAACISSYSCFQYAGLLKDLGKVYSLYDHFYFEKMNKTIKLELEQNSGSDEEDEDATFDTSKYEDLIQYSPTFTKFMADHPILEKDTKALLGKIRHVGKHAAGVVIYDDIIHSQPVMLVDGVVQTSLTEGVREKTLSEFGYVKMDILGLSTLKVIHQCLDMIGEKSGKSWKVLYDELINPEKMDLNDPKIYEHIYKKGVLKGIFQFETNSIKSMIDKTKPDCFEDLVAINALFRPGPLMSGMAYEYGDRKRGMIRCDYYNSDVVKNVLKPTYGLIIYQEQVMQLGEFVGKFDKSETNDLRKTLMKAKKSDATIKEKLEKMKKRFFDSAIENGMKNEDIEKLWQDMVNFAGYGFNRAHSCAYAMVAYQCSYLKTYYPLEFYCALLRNESTDNYSIVINELKTQGFKIKGLDFSKVCKTFSIYNNEIFFGFENIDGIGPKAAEELYKCFSNEEYKGFVEFISRDNVEWRKVNKKVIEALIKIGAFDDGKEEQRNKLLEAYMNYNDWKNHLPKKLQLISKQQKIDRLTQELDAITSYSKIPDSEMVELEKEYYKANLNFSPFDINGRKQIIKKLMETNQVGTLDENKKYTLVQFKEVKRFNDKRGKEMAFIIMADINGKTETGVVFSSNYRGSEIQLSKIYIVSGKRDGKMLLDKYINIETINF